MRAVQVHTPGGPEALRLVDLPKPMPGAGEVRVKAFAIGVGRPDVLIRQGTYKWMPPLPAIPGAELAGEIDRLGEGVTQWRVGDRVLVSARELAQRGGCYAEAMVVNALAPYRLPAAIDFADAVSLPNLQLALALMRIAGPVPSHKPSAIFITGASGGVASLLALLAKHLGFQTIGSSRSDAKQQFARAHGFDHVLGGSAEEWPAQVQQLTAGTGVTFAFDHLGGQPLIACLQSLAPLGTVVSYNAVQGLPGEDVFKVMRGLLGKSLGLRCFSMHTFDQDIPLRRELMQAAIDLMVNGQVKPPRPDRFAFDQVQRTHEMLDGGEVAGKIVLIP